MVPSVCIQLMDILQGFVDMKLMMDKPERGNQKLLTEHYKVDKLYVCQLLILHIFNCAISLLNETAHFIYIVNALMPIYT